jgi:hypothetical protein
MKTVRLPFQIMYKKTIQNSTKSVSKDNIMSILVSFIHYNNKSGNAVHYKYTYLQNFVEISSTCEE